MHWEDGIRFYLDKWQYFTLEFLIWIYILQAGIKTIPYFNAARKELWLKIFGSADCSLTWWYSVVVPLTGKLYVGCQVGWGKSCVLFGNFLYHILAEGDSRPSSSYILSLLVPWMAVEIAKHEYIVFFLILSQNIHYQVCNILYLHKLNVNEQTFCI